HSTAGRTSMSRNTQPSHKATARHATDEEDWIKIDLHIHTLDDPKDAVDFSAHQLLERARSFGFRVLAITLHDAVFDRKEVFADAACAHGRECFCGIAQRPAAPNKSAFEHARFCKRDLFCFPQTSISRPPEVRQDVRTFWYSKPVWRLNAEVTPSLGRKLRP